MSKPRVSRAHTLVGAATKILRTRGKLHQEDFRVELAKELTHGRFREEDLKNPKWVGAVVTAADMNTLWYQMERLYQMARVSKGEWTLRAEGEWQRLPPALEEALTKEGAVAMPAAPVEVAPTPPPQWQAEKLPEISKPPPEPKKSPVVVEHRGTQGVIIPTTPELQKLLMTQTEVLLSMLGVPDARALGILPGSPNSETLLRMIYAIGMLKGRQ